MQDHWNNPVEDDPALVPAEAERDVMEEFMFKRRLLMDWARYEKRHTECVAAAIAAPNPTEYIKAAQRAGHWRQLAEQYSRLAGVLMEASDIRAGLLWAMMELEKNEAAQETAKADE